MIKFIKLVTFDEIISEVVDEGENIQLIWPMRVYSEKTDEGEIKNRVVHYVPHVKAHTVLISKDKILYVADPIPSLQEYYENNVSAMLPKQAAEEQTEEV